MRAVPRTDAFIRCVNERYLPDGAPEMEGDELDTPLPEWGKLILHKEEENKQVAKEW